MERSLVVTGKSLEQALTKASVLLHCDPANVGYEIVQLGKIGRSGVAETPYKLRVSAMSPTADSGNQASNAEEELFTPHLPWLANTLAPLLPDMFCMAKDCACRPLTAVVRASNKPMTSSPQTGHALPLTGLANSSRSSQSTCQYYYLDISMA